MTVATIADFMEHIHAAKEYMKGVSITAPQRIYISKCVSTITEIIVLRGINLKEDFTQLYNLNIKEVVYLYNLLMLGLRVEEGEDCVEAYMNTLGRIDNSLLARITRSMLNPSLFRKLTEQELQTLTRIRNSVTSST